MNIKDQQNATDSPRVEVGEVDTRAPFQSVKDAVDLFGKGAFSGEKSSMKTKSHSAERVLANETKLHLVQKELNKLREKIENAETTKTQALEELENARKTAENLNLKLNAITESKESAINETEAAKTRARQIKETNSGIAVSTDGAWKRELEATRGQYRIAITELDSAKQELRKIHQEFDTSLEAKAMAFNRVAEANVTVKANTERASELSKEIASVQETIGEVKHASFEAQQEQAKIYAEKDAMRQLHKAALESSTNKLLSLKEEFDPKLVRNLESQLAETAAGIGALQKEIENARASDLDSVNGVTVELDDAKESLQKVVEEENSLQILLKSLKLELEKVKSEHSQLKEKEAETESVAGTLHVELLKSKRDLEACIAEEAKARGASEELISTLHQLSSEAENARRETEELKKKAEELKVEAETARSALEEAEEKLRVATEEAEEAKAAETMAVNQVKILSERTSAARSSTSESGAKITLSAEEFESLSRKVEESDVLAEMKVAAANAQVDAVRVSENEALKRLEAMREDISEMKSATEAALKRAEMAEAARRAVEAELRRLREREQKRATETASRILAEATVSPKSSPQLHYTIQKQNPPEKVVRVQKVEKEKVAVSKKVLLPNFSGIFHRKKNQVDGGSPSFLPGEKYV